MRNASGVVHGTNARQAERVGLIRVLAVSLALIGLVGLGLFAYF
jgi:phage shock protein PspC (stress-responsive transcriptional regulator)